MSPTNRWRAARHADALTITSELLGIAALLMVAPVLTR